MRRGADDGQNRSPRRSSASSHTWLFLVEAECEAAAVEVKEPWTLEMDYVPPGVVGNQTRKRGPRAAALALAIARAGVAFRKAQGCD